jgi:predicted MFS family arabinose efflux permease
MSIRERFGPTFPRIFAAALLQEVAFTLLIHFPGYLDELGATASMIGLLYAVAAVFGLLMRPALGRILDLTHRRTVLLVTGAVNAAVMFALATTSEWGVLLWTLFVIQRLMQIALFTSMLTYAADSLSPKRRTQGLAIFGLSGLLPIALGGILGDLIIEWSGFVGLFVAAGVSELIAWSLVFGLPTLPVVGRQPRRGFWSAMFQRNLLPLWWATLCFAAGLEIIFTFARNSIDARQVGSAGLFFGFYGFSAAITRLAGGSRYDRLPQRTLIVASTLLYAGGLGLLALAQSILVLAAAATASGIAHGAVFPILSSQVVHRARVAERGSAMSTFTSLFEVAVLLAAPVVGLLIDGFSYGVGFGATALFLVLGALVYSVWDSRMVATTQIEA